MKLLEHDKQYQSRRSIEHCSSGYSTRSENEHHFYPASLSNSNPQRPTMIRLLLGNPSAHLPSTARLILFPLLHGSLMPIPPLNPHILPQALVSQAFYSTPRPPSRVRKKKRRSAAPPPLDQAELERAIAALPARFSSSDLADAVSRHPDPRIAFHLLTWASHHPNPRSRPGPPAFLAAIKRLGSARLYQELHSLASLALSLPSADGALFNTVIYFFAEARMLTRAVGVYRRMRAHPDPACRPSARTYNILFAALLGRGANSYVHHVYMDTLRCLFHQMVDAGIAPDVFALNAMIKGYVLSLHVNDALRIFHQMEPVYNCPPNEHSYNFLVHGLCAQGRTRNARQLFDEMRAEGMVPGARACNSLTSALAMAGEVEEATTLIREMRRMGRAADRITCRTVLEKVCTQTGVRNALQLLQELREEEIVDGRTHRELLHWIEDEFGGKGGVGLNGRCGLELSAAACPP